MGPEKGNESKKVKRKIMRTTIEVAWTYGENGGEPVGKEKRMIRCERCEVEKKAMNGMDEQCEKSVE